MFIWVHHFGCSVSWLLILRAMGDSTSHALCPGLVGTTNYRNRAYNQHRCLGSQLRSARDGITNAPLQNPIKGIDPGY